MNNTLASAIQPTDRSDAVKEQAPVVELRDVELAFVGGGMANVAFQ